MAIVAELGNGEGLNAALGAAASQLVAKQVDQIAKGIAGGNGTLANVISNVVSGAIGMAAGGESGATSASTMDRYNRQMHPDQQARLASLCSKNPERCKEFIAAACALTDCGTDLPDSDAYKNILMALEQIGNGEDAEYARQLLNADGLFNPREGESLLSRASEFFLFTGSYYFDKEYWDREYISGNRPAAGVWDDDANAWVMQHDEGVTKATGAAYAVIGAANIVLGYGTIEASPVTGGLMVVGGSIVYTGGVDMVLGPYESSHGQEVFNALFKPYESQLGCVNIIE